MLLKKCGLPLGLSLVAVVCVYAAQPITEITLPGSDIGAYQSNGTCNKH